VRPTSDYLREALFDILGASVRGVRFLDLYAGSGAVGIEALSRGVAEAVFVEQDRRCLQTLRENLQTVGLGMGEVMSGDVLKVLRRLASQGRSFDIIFLDPPYGTDLARQALLLLGSTPLLRSGGVVVVEHFAKDSLPVDAGDLLKVREKAYGQTVLSFYGRRKESRP
jgi:16S rRNA (guanine(966)-N(2))-methyltransferase RsmD